MSAKTFLHKLIGRAWLSLLGLKYRAARLLHRYVLPERARASTDTMGEYKRVLALPDDAPPGLRKPPDGPHADLIRRVRLYAQHGAKALSPLLDRPLPTLEDGSTNLDGLRRILIECDEHARANGAVVPAEVLAALNPNKWSVVEVAAIHSAYNSAWCVKDGEVWEVET